MFAKYHWKALRWVRQAQLEIAHFYEFCTAKMGARGDWWPPTIEVNWGRGDGGESSSHPNPQIWKLVEPQIQIWRTTIFREIYSNYQFGLQLRNLHSKRFDFSSLQKFSHVMQEDNVSANSVIPMQRHWLSTDIVTKSHHSMSYDCKYLIALMSTYSTHICNIIIINK